MGEENEEPTEDTCKPSDKVGSSDQVSSSEAAAPLDTELASSELDDVVGGAARKLTSLLPTANLTLKRGYVP